MKKYKKGHEARQSLIDGINKLAECTNPTLGPAGKAAVIGRDGLPPKIVDDAVSIAMSFELEDKFENDAVMLMKETLLRTSKDVGDATATTLNLTQAISKAVFAKLPKEEESFLQVKKVNTIQLKKELDKACLEITKKLKEASRPLSKEEIRSVALTTGTYDWIADMVTEIFEQIGENGFVFIEDGVTTGYKVWNGIEIKTGYNSEYFINSADRECVLGNPYILVSNQKLERTLIEKAFSFIVNEDNKDLVIVAPDFDEVTLKILVKAKIEHGINLIALKLPTFGKDDILIDVATITGAKFLDKSAFATYDDMLNSITKDTLGTVNKAIISQSKTVLAGGTGDTTKRVEELKAVKDKTESAFDKEELDKRIAYLSGGTANVTIGGYSDTEREYYRLKLENSVNSVQNALRMGVVKGGGLALKEIGESTPSLISEAIKSPYKTIQENNGEPFDVPDTVLDPVKNVMGALESARSIVGAILLAETSITYKDETEDKDED